MPKKRPDIDKYYGRTFQVKVVLKSLATKLRQIVTNNHINNLK